MNMHLKATMCSAILPFFACAASKDLFYYCTFDSNDAVKNPVVGSSGICRNATYQAGKVGNALAVPAGRGVVSVPLPNGLPAGKGCIEFWAKLTSGKAYYSNLGDPSFFKVLKEGDSFTAERTEISTLLFTNNDGSGGGGLTYRLGNVYRAPSSYEISGLYSSVIGDQAAWHHYALVWNVDGIEGTSDNVRLYIDGAKYHTVTGVSADNFRTRMATASVLWFALPFDSTLPDCNRSPFLIDEFKIWSKDRTRFSGPTVSDYSGDYDGLGHSVSVSDEDGTVRYALTETGPYTSLKPLFTNVVEAADVWYKVGDDDAQCATVTITAKPLTAGMITVTDACVYDGTAQEPKFTVSDGSPSIIADSDWRLVEYANNVAAGKATVRIAAVEGGNYCGEAVGTFAIAKAGYDMSGATWSAERSFVYDGQTHGVSLLGLPEGVTATLSGHEAKDAGAYVATASFAYDAANYTAPSVAPCAWEIRKRDLVLRVADKDKSYDGYALSASGGDVSADGYVDGEALDYYDFTTLTEMGSGTSSFSFRDSASAKASNYNVMVVEGRLRVTIGGSVYAGEVVSAKMRENDPTIMDVKYVVRSMKDTVDVRLVVFEDGARSFANVIVPEAFADGTEANVGDGVSANTTNTVAWRVSEDWNVDLAKVKVEVLVKPSATYLPFKWVTIPGRNGRPMMKVSTNETAGNDLFNALLWCVADKDEGLVLAEGVLKSGAEVLASGTELTANAAGFVFGKMGYGVLDGEDLEYVRGALRKPLKGGAPYSRYAVKVIGE